MSTNRRNGKKKSPKMALKIDVPVKASKISNSDQFEHDDFVIGKDGLVKGITYSDLEIFTNAKLGEGVSSYVLKASHKSTGSDYALKVISLYSSDITHQQIVREVKSLYEAVNCPFIIKFYDAYCVEGSIRILLEYMDCGSLLDIENYMKKIPENVLSQISHQILKGLEFTFKKGIIHRDIKPSNILLNKDGFVKISDFGLSRQLNATIKNATTFQGTYLYMSPERMKGEKYSFDSDIWSFGLTVAECAIGRFPLSLENMGLWDVLKHLQENDISLNPSEASPELIDFVSKCCHIKPDQRQTPSQLLQHPFITKYNENDDYTVLKNWINKVYVPTKRAIRKEKRNKK